MNNLTKFLIIFFILLTAFWLGESHKGILQIQPHIIGAAGTILSFYFFRKKRRYRYLYLIAFIMLYTLFFYFGTLSFNKTYRECINEGEKIRILLSEYKITHGKFPDSLNTLNISLPCSRFIRGTLLEYETNGTSYKLLFHGNVNLKISTDKMPFGSVQKVLQKRKDHGMWCLAEHPHLRRREPWSRGNLSLAWVK